MFRVVLGAAQLCWDIVFMPQLDQKKKKSACGRKVCFGCKPTCAQFNNIHLCSVISALIFYLEAIGP